LGSKTKNRDQRLGIEYSGSKTMDRRLVTWGQRLKIEDLMGLMTRWDRRLRNKDSLGLGSKTGLLGSKTQDLRLFWIEDTLGSNKTWGNRLRNGDSSGSKTGLFWDRRPSMKKSFGSKTRWDQRLVGIKDWRSKTGFVGFEDSLGSKTWDQRLVVIKDSGSKTC
jgi:hypothetical protein